MNKDTTFEKIFREEPMENMQANVDQIVATRVTQEVDKLTDVAKGESIIQERVQREVEQLKTKLSGNSALIAGVLGILSANALVYMEHVSWLQGDYRYWIASAIGLVAGIALGERIMLLGVGILVGLKIPTL